MHLLSHHIPLPLPAVVFILGVVVLNAVAGPKEDTKMPQGADRDLLFIDSKFGPAVRPSGARLLCWPSLPFMHILFTPLPFVDYSSFPVPPQIGVISFAFVCHHACFIVYNTLRDNTDR